MVDDETENNPSGHLTPDGLARRLALVGTLLAFSGGAVFSGTGSTTASVTHNALVHLEATATRSCAVARFGIATGHPYRLDAAAFGGRLAVGEAPVRRDRLSAGGSEADEESGGEEGKFRFHG